MTNSNYYDPKRKYAGEWAYCYSREDLFSIPEYVELYRKAEQGDIAAMLDLAIGFLPKKDRVWGQEQLVCMPKNRSYYNDEYDALDARYYFWILRACNSAIDCNIRREDFPHKYIATALFEALKFLTRVKLFSLGNYAAVVQGRDIIWKDQFELVRQIYGEDCIQGVDVSAVPALLLLFVKAYGFDVIDPLHFAHCREEDIRFIFACLAYYDGIRIEESSCKILDFRTDTISFEYLTELRPADGSCDEYYNACLQFKAAQEEEERKQLEEARRQQEAAAQAAVSAVVEAPAAAAAKQKKPHRGLRFLLIVLAVFFLFSEANDLGVDVSRLLPERLTACWQVETLDPFADLEVRVIGAAPDIRVELWDNSLHSFMKEVDFTASATNALTEGDSIKVIANYSKLSALKAGYRLEPTTMTYTIGEVAHYTQSCEEIERNVRSLFP